MKVVFLLQKSNVDFPLIEVDSIDFLELDSEDKWNLASFQMNGIATISAGVRHGKEWFFVTTPLDPITEEKKIFAFNHAREYPSQILAKIKEEMNEIDFNQIASILKKKKRISEKICETLAEFV